VEREQEGQRGAVEEWKGLKKSRSEGKGQQEKTLKEEPTSFSSFWLQKVAI